MPAKTYLFYHIVLTTKYRRPHLAAPRVLSVINLALKIQSREHGAEVVAWNAGTDYAHMHALVLLPPSARVADFVRDLKSHSARLANAQLNRTGDRFWAKRYFAATVGHGSIEDARRYIADQFDTWYR